MQLPKQFLLAKAPLTGFPSWRKIPLFDWWLSLAPEVPLVRVRNKNGRETGLLFGWILWRGRLLKNGDVIQWREPEQDNGLAAEYDELGGRFVYLFKCRNQLSAVTDPGGLMSLVFSTEGSMAASSPAVIRLVEELDENARITRAFSCAVRELWYPFGVTPYTGIQRLLPNHRLNLSDRCSIRYFPQPQGEGLHGNPQVDVESIAVNIAQWVRGNVRALVESGHNVAHLTGGFDSRMVLAASREFLPEMRFQTISMRDSRTRLDCHIAARIARQFGLDYRQLPFVAPADCEIEQWLERTGHCIKDTVAALCASARVYNTHCHEITGTCGEAMRTPYWYNGDEKRQSLSPREFLHRLEINENEVTVQLSREWLASLPSGMSVGNILDIAYTELRLGCWAGPSMYGHEIALPSISPFNSLRYYKALLSLPETERARQQLCRAVVNTLWPELLRYPFNRAHGLAKLRFLQQELRLMLPVKLRDHIKRQIRALGNGDSDLLEKLRG
ncbi:hypothetical protein PVT68_08035 [Microbulbifer bruguierae]|uniref:Asparagine synthetase domain-containing protein n=1 Tax=Microbulbifer bruguierae TaxID=3029061 RepID=A0ABY8NJG1_9GAMM|nr:hypothetical protein [Microbulbifer bruguierae]WGL18232.1 hypothetical protein PVT68_08035 [Microbulbifer bruguierae]